MTNTSPQTLESLISVCADSDNFHAVISNLQSLHQYLQHNSSPRCEDDYLKLMAHLLENYLDTPKQLFLRQYLGEMIARQAQDDYSAQYFKQRFTNAEILDLLKNHRKLTGRRLILTSVDYDRQKFKVKTCLA
ncbi:MAG: hypothetical protein QNJ34_14825 [Xenococcaceae cyanobacterium MO_188.B29]|nr:hypothetical protein [Xenococcaceae cyanobacterium MO_188.B29]